jgi:hypothetical protein
MVPDSFSALKGTYMAAVAAIIALILVLIGVFAAVKILFWIGVAVAVVAVVLFLAGYRSYNTFTRTRR